MGLQPTFLLKCPAMWAMWGQTTNPDVPAQWLSSPFTAFLYSSCVLQPCPQTHKQDTYYNPIPHFGYELAVKHSPDIVNIPLRRPNQGPKTTKGGSTPFKAETVSKPNENDGLGGGMDDF